MQRERSIEPCDAISAGVKALWTDPVWRANMMAARAAKRVSIWTPRTVLTLVRARMSGASLEVAAAAAGVSISAARVKLLALGCPRLKSELRSGAVSHEAPRGVSPSQTRRGSTAGRAAFLGDGT